MRKLYLDIDGILLTKRNPRAADGAIELIDYVLSNFDCYWLFGRRQETPGRTVRCPSRIRNFDVAKTYFRQMHPKIPHCSQNATLCEQVLRILRACFENFSL